MGSNITNNSVNGIDKCLGVNININGIIGLHYQYSLFGEDMNLKKV